MKTKFMSLVGLSVLVASIGSVSFASDKEIQTKEQVVTQDKSSGTRAVAQEAPVEKKKVPYHTGVKGNR